MAKNNPRKSRPSVKASRKVIDPSGVIDAKASVDDASQSDATASSDSSIPAAAITGTAGSILDTAADLDVSEGSPTGFDGSSTIEADGEDTTAADAADISAPLPTITEEELESRIEKQRERISNAERERKRRRRRKVLKWILIILVLLIVAAAVAICVVFALFRWNTYDDAQDIQGRWLVDGSDTPITITDDTIRLTDDVAYKYTIDPDSKTIEFSFGNMKGTGRYRFSFDRNQLMIEDGDFDWWGSLLDDAQWTATAFIYSLQNDEDLPPDIEAPEAMLVLRDGPTDTEAPIEDNLGPDNGSG